jgi:hypothetical protein
VGLIGAVNQPAVYELKTGETLEFADHGRRFQRRGGPQQRVD